MLNAVIDACVTSQNPASIHREACGRAKFEIYTGSALLSLLVHEKGSFGLLAVGAPPAYRRDTSAWAGIQVDTKDHTNEEIGPGHGAWK